MSGFIGETRKNLCVFKLQSNCSRTITLTPAVPITYLQNCCKDEHKQAVSRISHYSQMSGSRLAASCSCRL